MHVDMRVNGFEQFTWRVNQQQNEAAATWPRGRSLYPVIPFFYDASARVPVRLSVYVRAQKTPLRVQGARGGESVKVQLFRNAEQEFGFGVYRFTANDAAF